MEFFHKTHIDFMARRRIAIAVSLMAILAGMASLFVKGGPAYNIDFLGGTELQIRFTQPKSIQALRDALTALNLGEAEIKQFDDPRDFVIRLPMQAEQTVGSDGILTGLKESFPSDPPALEALTTIGPKIGHELRESAIWAVLLSLGMILIYISIRFEFVFALGAVVALFHDVLITLGIFSILDREISLAVLGAFLTLIGYSLNDTIVVFDRIRENLKIQRRDVLAIDQTINLSINDTLSRTILTGVTTLMVIVVCLFFGGEVLRDFFFCLFIGIFVGTYSSIYIAAPVVAKWYAAWSARKTRLHTSLAR